ncbi:hypothetical protein SAMN04487910_3720 [Aquimarina amphilecti]|uniref:Uncharacterized protein n=1 Tax=Aquimarina amphilecti TaxID=1038014 RepID=A0A1H7UFY2_AQUAM|nr:hypothetical protein [Aquimarina amphilecti]SEL95933.1 hypothetical protein SAMN04487910_3720 [Aquimarina amphilecti]
MYQRVLTHIITLLFAAAFLIPRVANLHALSHLSDDDSSFSCELCDILADSYQLDLADNTQNYAENELKSIPNSSVVFLKYNSPQEKIASPSSVYNKPPPFI